MTPGIVELDLHGCNVHQAQVAIQSALRRSRGAYRIRIIHGYNSGSALRDMIRSVYRSHPQVLRLEMGLNQGQTDLVLREFL